jgi:hypothetical protein
VELMVARNATREPFREHQEPVEEARQLGS